MPPQLAERCKFLLSQGQLDDAAIIAKFLLRRTKNDEISIILGYILLLQSRYEAATAVLSDTHSFEGAYFHAVGCFYSGHFTQATAILRKIMTLKIGAQESWTVSSISDEMLFQLETVIMGALKDGETSEVAENSENNNVVTGVQSKVFPTAWRCSRGRLRALSLSSPVVKRRRLQHETGLSIQAVQSKCEPKILDINLNILDSNLPTGDILAILKHFSRVVCSPECTQYPLEYYPKLIWHFGSRTELIKIASYWKKLSAMKSLAFIAMGCLSNLLQNNEAAIRFYQMALYCDAPISKSYILQLIGFEHLEAGRFEEAKDTFQASMKFNSSPSTAFGLGLASYRLKEYTVSLEFFREAVRLQPLSSNAFCYMGVIFEKLNRSDEAQALYRQAISMNSHDPKPKFQLAKLLCERNQFTVHTSIGACTNP